MVWLYDDQHEPTISAERISMRQISTQYGTVWKTMGDILGFYWHYGKSLTTCF